MCWSADNVLLGKSAAEQGRHLILSLNCSGWWVSRVGHTGKALTVHFKLCTHKVGIEDALATELQFKVVQNKENDVLEYSVCSSGTRKSAAGKGDENEKPRSLLIFEGTPRDGEGFQKVLTHRENLLKVCQEHAQNLSFIDLAEMLASMPILPAAWADVVRARILEDAAAEAAWEEDSSSTQLDPGCSTQLTSSPSNRGASGSGDSVHAKS